MNDEVTKKCIIPISQIKFYDYYKRLSCKAPSQGAIRLIIARELPNLSIPLDSHIGGLHAWSQLRTGSF
jgi:hypothetical protein